MSTLLQTKIVSKEEISERIRSLRDKMGYRSMDQVAEMLGYSRTQLYMIESGERPVTLKFVAALERAEHSAGVTLQNETRLAEPAAEYRAGPPAAGGLAATDAEITGLAALVSLRAAQLTAGQADADVPIVAEALERALASRGWRVRE